MSKIEKEKLIIDFDGCITNSVKQVVSMYNKDFKYYKNFQFIDWTKINSWDFKECTLMNKDIVEDYFSQYRFFDDNLEFMDNAKEVISESSKDFVIIICSIGSGDNLRYKREWIKRKLPCVDEFIGINMKYFKDKSVIDMSDAFAFIDDSSNNLINSNCNKVICFGDEYSWNSNWQGTRCYNWYDVKRYLDKIR